MKYKLLKDLPFAKAGEVFERVTYKSKDGLSDYDYFKTSKREKDGEDEVLFTIDYNYFLDNFDEWFEKIEEPTTSVRRTPKMGEAYFCVDEYGNVEREIWDNDGVDNELLAMGFVRLTPEEAAEARDRRLAEVRLRQTSNFKPDFENCEGGWVVGYGYDDNSLIAISVDNADYGEIVRYATKEEAEKSIRENERDWKIFFGIKEEE
jgi:hypothetical protein|nr:MAG TPA: hypothetical protein [Caudoviricetes sp.]